MMKADRPSCRRESRLSSLLRLGKRQRRWVRGGLTASPIERRFDQMQDGALHVRCHASRPTLTEKLFP